MAAYCQKCVNVCKPAVNLFNISSTKSLPLCGFSSRSNFNAYNYSYFLKKKYWKLNRQISSLYTGTGVPYDHMCNEKITTLNHILRQEFSTENSKSDKEAEEKRKRDAASWKAIKMTFYVLGIGGSAFLLWFIYDSGGPKRDADGSIIPDEFSDLPIVQQYLYRTWSELKFYNKMIKEPSREMLLPPPLTEPYYQPPYTLVLEMKGVLVHPDWTYSTGWRFKKRPAVEFFLQQVGPPLFEVVIYTSEQGFTAFPIIDALDPQGYIMYRLFRDATRYMNGVHVKDLNCLNRDLSKVIMVDWNKKAVELNPENALFVKKWEGGDDDRSLVELAIMLRTIASSGVSDVREVLNYYQQFDDPIAAFRENQRLAQEQQEEQMKQEKQTSLTGTFKFFRR